MINTFLIIYEFSSHTTREQEMHRSMKRTCESFNKINLLANELTRLHDECPATSISYDIKLHIIKLFLFQLISLKIVTKIFRRSSLGV